MTNLVRRCAPLLVASAMLLGASAAFADAPQTDDARALAARIAADEASVAKLERMLGDTEKQAGVVKVADLFGESDKDKAARLQREQAQDSSIASLNQRVNDLEDTLRRLTGQMEELDHRVSEFNSRIDRMQKDFDYKLCTVIGQQMGGSSDDQAALPCNGGGQPQATMPPAPMQGAAPPPAGGPIHLAPPPGVLGTLPQGTPMPQPPGDDAQGAPPMQTASLENHTQFDAAMKLLAQAQYAEASSAFRTFADTYPKDDLAPQAIYWIGDIAFVQKDYPNAAHAFAEELKKFPSSPRAPDSMLKLGQSLLAMNQKKEGCTALAALQKSYPTASKTVQAQAIAARKAATCR